MQKYELTEETIIHDGRTLHRIKRLSDGKLGGFIEKESNLSQEGNCFISDDAKVYGSAEIYGDAQVFGNASVHAFARVFDKASVGDNVDIYGGVEVYDNAKISGDCGSYRQG